jgi:hypothetical protein
MKQYHKNPRQITTKQFTDLKTWLRELGDLSGIVHDLNSDEIVGGNQRSRVFSIDRCKIELTQRFDQPDDQGTVGLGFIIWEGKRYAYRQVRWTPEQCEKANVIANKAGGSWDYDILKSEFEVSDLEQWGFSPQELELLSGFGEDGNDVQAGEPVYSTEQVIDAAFRHFRAKGFPYRRLPVHVCLQEINKLATTEPEQLLHTNTGYEIGDTYHPHRFHASAEGMKSPLEAFADDNLLKRAIRLWLENGSMLGTDYWGTLGLVSGTQAVSNFRPGFACYLYRKYCEPGSVVLDCSAGYGGRLVGAIASGVVQLYIGIDPCKQTHGGNKRLAHDLGFSNRVKLYNLPAEDVDPKKLAGHCDFGFTSPPYFRKEHYSEEETQSYRRYPTGDGWRKGFLRPMLALQYAALKPGCYNLINIADVKIKSKSYPLESWAVEDGQAIGFEHVRTDRYELTHRYGSGSDEVMTEPVIVFRKPS